MTKTGVRNISYHWVKYFEDDGQVLWFGYERHTTYYGNGNVSTKMLASILLNEDEYGYSWSVEARPRPISGISPTLKEAKRMCRAFCALEGLL